jgi:hypothetical protein
MRIEQIIRDTRLIGHCLIEAEAGILIAVQGIIQAARLVSHARAQVGGLDLLGRVELEGIAMLVNGIKGRVQPAVHIGRRLRVAPTGGPFVSVPIGMRVFET